MGTQIPAPQRWPAAHCWAVEHVQKPSVHCPLEPHWELVTQVPHVLCAQTCPPPHWLFDVHALHMPLMHARPSMG